MKNWVHFVTACGCTKMQEWNGRPYPRIEVLISAKPRVIHDKEVGDWTMSHARREFELYSQVALENGDWVWTYHEVPR